MSHPAKNRESETKNLQARPGVRRSVLDARLSIFNAHFSVLQILVHIAYLVPLALLIWDGLHNDLTANPIQEITHRTGKTALILLVL